MEFDERQRQIVKAILDDPEATIRFYGRDYYHDHVVTEVEKRELKRVLDLSKMLGQSIGHNLVSLLSSCCS